MPLDQKGRNILKAARYEQVRKDLAKAVAEHIRDRGSAGEDFHSIVEKVLQEDRFKKFFENLVKHTQRATDLSERDSRSCASMLVSEQTGRDLERVVPELVVERDGKPAERKERLFQKLRNCGVVKGAYVERAVMCKRGGFVASVADVLRNHPIILVVVGVGAAFVALGAMLIGSVYQALLAALTLQASNVSTVPAKIGNILAALGGVLLFFTSVSLVISHILEQDRKRRMVYRLADQYLQKAK